MVFLNRVGYCHHTSRLKIPIAIFLDTEAFDGSHVGSMTPLVMIPPVFVLLVSPIVALL
jgi:hypothetical protein